MISDVVAFLKSHIMTIITFTSALTGLVFSIFNFISAHRSKRKKLTVCFGVMEVKDYVIDVFNKNPLHIYFQFENRSELPISITRIRVLANSEWYDSEARNYLIEETSYKVGKSTIKEKYIWNTILPVNLPSLGAVSGYLVFLIPPDTLSNNETVLTFEISTNRGKAVRKTLSLYEACRL